ncbi:MAG: LA2681 family HEPN domain-containing protein [Thermodesulfobacteriota bacterium]
MEDITREYIKLDKESQSKSLSDDYIFKKIAEFDSKFKNRKEHHEAFEGLLSNIGADQKSIAILNCVIKRLKSKKDKLSPNKYYYDLGNTILTKADIERRPPDSFEHLVTSSSRYKEAKDILLLVQSDDTDHFQRARTNIANILEKYGRNYEALFAYDEVLKTDTNFGMALGNKAIAIGYYTQLAPQQSLVLLNNCYNLLRKALSDPRLAEIGGKLVANDFAKRISILERYFSEISFTPKQTEIPKSLSLYQKFTLENNLFLNYDFGYYYDKHSLCDSFFPNVIEDMRSIRSSKTSLMSNKTYFTFQVFNQLLEDFVTSRYNFHKAITVKSKKIDSQTNYIYTYDYTYHSLQNGMLKSVFSMLYNCLDKIAHLIKYYFYQSESDPNKVNIYFDWLTTDEFKQILLEQNSYQLLSLYALALDFKSNSQYCSLNTTRNRITHSFLNIYDEFFAPDELEHSETTAELLVENIFTLFMVVKAAIFYSTIAIKEKANSHDSAGKLDATMQKRIFS